MARRQSQQIIQNAVKNKTTKDKTQVKTWHILKKNNKTS